MDSEPAPPSSRGMFQQEQDNPRDVEQDNYYGQSDRGAPNYSRGGMDRRDDYGGYGQDQQGAYGMEDRFGGLSRGQQQPGYVQDDPYGRTPYGRADPDFRRDGIQDLRQTNFGGVNQRNINFPQFNDPSKNFSITTFCRDFDENAYGIKIRVSDPYPNVFRSPGSKKQKYNFKL